MSRYLNGHTVRRANRDRIERAIEQLGYRRNAVASAMKTDVTHMVGFMVPAFSEFHAGLLEQLSRRMRHTGRAVIYLLPRGRSRVRSSRGWSSSPRTASMRLIMTGRRRLHER